ncbi:F-box domain protein [Aspergillus stella-maris]|uniref:F-box domain protein n=1 Tax=Aspergillus stella-maris TaxID=1810926 RepID=UPI003CCCAAF8
MSTFEQCPAEIVDIILSFLDLRDICTFRLTSRGLAYKVSSAPSLRLHLQQRHVDITEHSLRALAKATAKPDRPGCFIQDLTLVGVANNTKFLTREAKFMARKDAVGHAKAQQILPILTRRQKEFETMHASGYDVLLLSQVFRNLMVHGRRKGLRSLSLTVVVYREDAQKRLLPADGGGWKLIWQAATDTFHTALGALTTSGIAVQRLDIYNSVQRCSLSGNEPHSVNFGFNALATSLASLETLAVSFSDRAINVYNEDIGYTSDSADSLDPMIDAREPGNIEEEVCLETSFSGIPALVQNCQRLESLELHHYQLSFMAGDMVNSHRERFLQHIAKMASLPPLKRVVLRGFRTRAADLLTFLARLKPTLRDLSLQNLIIKLLSSKI